MAHKLQIFHKIIFTKLFSLVFVLVFCYYTASLQKTTITHLKGAGSMLTPSVAVLLFPWGVALAVAVVWSTICVRGRRKALRAEPAVELERTSLWVLAVIVSTCLLGGAGYAFGVGVVAVSVIRVEPGEVLVNQNIYYPYEVLDHGCIWGSHARGSYRVEVVSTGIYIPAHSFPVPSQKRLKTIRCEANFLRPNTPYAAWREWRDDLPTGILTDRALEAAYRLHQDEIESLTNPDDESQQARFRAIMEPEVNRLLPSWLQLEPGSLKFNFGE